MIDVNQLRKGVTFVTDNDLWRVLAVSYTHLTLPTTPYV